jgi:transcriptional regulator with XRE-family HTH domain
MSKLGRKKNGKDTYKPAVVSTRLEWEEYERLRDTVEKLGMTTSEYLRYLILNKKQPKVNINKIIKKCEGLKQVAREINAIGINLNQIARYTNKKREIDMAVLEKLVRIEEELNRLLYSIQTWLKRQVEDADTLATEQEYNQ